MKEFKPGQQFTMKTGEIFQAHRELRPNRCDGCFAKDDEDLCELIVAQCGDSRVIWKPADDVAVAMLVARKLEEHNK